MRRNLLKAVACASLFALTGLAQAASVTLTPGSAQTTVLQDPAGSGRTVTLSLPGGGTSHLEFSNGTGVLGGVPSDPLDVYGFVSVANVFATKVSSQGGAIINEKAVNDASGTPSRVYISVDANIASATFDSTTGIISSLSSTGSFTFTNPRIAGVSNGGTVTVSNLRVDLTNKVVFGDLAMVYKSVNATTRAITTVNSTLNKVAIWNFDQIQGATTIPVAALTTGNTTQIKSLGYEVLPNGRNGLDYSATIKLLNLRVTNAGLAALTNGLGAGSSTIGKAVLTSINGEADGWGSIVLTNKLATSLPQCTF
jgi:hypothetical protein